MSYLNSTTREELLELLETKEEQLELAREQLAEVLSTSIQEYRFNSGDGGNQWARRLSPKQVKDIVDELEREVALIKRRLRGGGLVNVVQRRR